MLIWMGTICIAALLIAMNAAFIGIPLLCLGVFMLAIWQPEPEPHLSINYPTETHLLSRELSATESVAYVRDERGRMMALRHRQLMWNETYNGGGRKIPD